MQPADMARNGELQTISLPPAVLVKSSWRMEPERSRSRRRSRGGCLRLTGGSSHCGRAWAVSTSSQSSEGMIKDRQPCLPVPAYDVPTPALSKRSPKGTRTAKCYFQLTCRKADDSVQRWHWHTGHCNRVDRYNDPTSSIQSHPASTSCRTRVRAGRRGAGS